MTTIDPDLLLPCKLGCTHENDGEQVPFPGVHNGYCTRCFGIMAAGLGVAPALVYHLLHLIPSALRSKQQGLGNMRTKGDSASLPFDASAMDDANKVFRILAYWYMEIKTSPKFYSAWRNSRGQVVGLPFNATPDAARATVGELADAIGSGMEQWLKNAPLEQVEEFKKDMASIRRTNIKWPTEDRPVFSVTALCPLDGQRVIVVPPREPQGDRTYVCSKCGAMYTEEEHDLHARYLKAMSKQVIKESA